MNKKGECGCISLKRPTSISGQLAFQLRMKEREDALKQEEDLLANDSLRENISLNNLVGSSADPAFVVEIFMDHQCHKGMTC